MSKWSHDNVWVILTRLSCPLSSDFSDEWRLQFHLIINAAGPQRIIRFNRACWANHKFIYVKLKRSVSSTCVRVQIDGRLFKITQRWYKTEELWRKYCFKAWRTCCQCWCAQQDETGLTKRLRIRNIQRAGRHWNEKHRSVEPLWWRQADSRGWWCDRWNEERAQARFVGMFLEAGKERQVYL